MLYIQENIIILSIFEFKGYIHDYITRRKKTDRKL